MSEHRDDDLADRVAALEETLDELRGELEPDRGPLGLPRPPSPWDVLRFTDEYAIPAAIAILEANVRLLELLRAVLRGARGAPREDEVRERATSLGRTTVDRVDRALADLQTAIEEADLPQNAEARSLLKEAKGLNADVRDALTNGTAESSGQADVGRAGTDVPDEHETPGTDAGSEVEIDVDAELASIKDELDGDDEESEGDGEERSDESGDTRDDTGE